MTVKSVIDVEVSTQAFQRYVQLWNRYREQAEKHPGLWKKISGESSAASAQFNKMAAAIQAQARVQREMSEVYKAQNQQLRQGERLWSSMASHAKGIATSILSATRSLISWTGIIGAAGGLLGAGSLFGIDRMARNAASERRSATGLGLSIGEQKAFDVNFGARLVDSGSFLSWISQMETDPRKAAAASALGTGLTGRTGADAVSILRAVRSRARGMDPRQMGMLPDMLHLEGVSGEDVRRLAAMSNREFEGLASRYGQDVGKLNIQDSTAEKWADFVRRLDEAKGAIFKTFVQGLLPLEKPLEHLSGAFEKFIQTLLKSDIVKHSIDTLAEWLDKFSGKISAPKFLEAVERFTSDMGEIADAAHVLAHPKESASRAWTGAQNWLSDKFMQIFRPDDFYRFGKKEDVDAFLARIDQQNSLPTGTTAAIWKQESGSSFNPNLTSAKGAVGPFQFLPRTAAAFGFDPHSFSDSASAAGFYLSQLRAQYKGDLDKALAAYNYGPTNLDYILKAHPSDWRRYVPGETRNYVAGVDRNISVTVNVTTPPGSDLNVAAAAVAH